MSARELITEHLDLWTGAVTKKSSSGRGSNGKLELTGVKKLRELIVELAVRGKLVEQNTGDTAAQELIKAIADLRQQKVNEGTLPKPKTFKLDTEHVPEYEIPKLWVLAPLGHLTLQITDGVHHTPNYLPSGVPFISVKDIDGRSVSFRDCKYISEEQHREINKRCNPEQGDILLCRIGTLGRATIVDTDIAFSLFVSVGLLKMPTTLISSRYVHLALHSPFVLQQMDQVKAGGSHTNKLNLGAIPMLHVPVPPMEEQQRIVQKVDELLALCDRLEQQTSDQLQAHETLVDTLLGTLTQSENANELADNWARLAAHFDTLFITEQSIDKLKQTILQLAVMGNLVSHVPNDEPARDLLQKMASEKDQLTKEKKIKKQRVLPSISDGEKPFELPQDWEWCRFQELIYDLKYGTSKKSDYSIQGTPILRIPNVVKGYIDSTDLKFSKLTDQELEELSLKENDILIIRSNGSSHIVGTATVVDKSHEGFAYAGYLVRLRTNTEVCDPDFLQYAFQSYLIRNQIEQPLRTTSGVKNINSTEISSLVLPLPPIEAQRRIVATIQNVMHICEELIERLNRASETRCQLAGAVVEGALS